MTLAERLSASEAILPRYRDASLVNVAASILDAFGARRDDDPEPVRGLDTDALREADAVVLVLVDGLGETQLRAAIERRDVPYLGELYAMPQRPSLTSIFPSSTVSALGSLDTARPPGAHGLVAYQHWLEEFGCVAQMLRWGPADRNASFADAPWNAEARGFVPIETVDARLARAGVARFLIQPAIFKNSPLVRMLSPDSTYVPYLATSSAAVVTRRLLRSRQWGEGRAFAFVYWSTLDTVAHFIGPRSEEHHAELRAIDRGLVAPLREALGGRVAFLLTADHGHAALDTSRAVRFEDHPELLGMLRYPPAGEHRVALLRARDGARDEVRAYCTERFADAIVADAEEAFDLGLYGLPITDATRTRVGDVVLIATGSSQYWYTFIQSELAAHLGSHGALTRDEMAIPLLAWTS
ncbi:MAG TPA: alkaline phosphatase family protein [Candidatus Dormibacteraeota bacterium]|nr:alkaline phosphatase family protein [Candidatus Dormibacteraeota bacterium]